MYVVVFLLWSLIDGDGIASLEDEEINEKPLSKYKFVKWKWLNPHL